MKNKHLCDSCGKSAKYHPSCEGEKLKIEWNKEPVEVNQKSYPAGIVKCSGYYPLHNC